MMSAAQPPHRRLWPSWLKGLALFATTVLAVVLSPRDAAAWVEATVLSDDVKVQVERNGTALVEHQIVMRLRGSPIKVFTLPGTDLDAQPEGEATVSIHREGAAPEGAIPLAVIPQAEGGLRLEVDDSKGISRGNFLFRFKYRTDLVKSGALERDGTMLRLRWLGPRIANGLDAAKAVFVIPSAPTEPKATSSERRDGDLERDMALSGAGAFLTTTRRFPDRDEVEMTRPHVARSEQVAWTMRVDPAALGAVNDPRLRPPPSEAVQHIVAHRAKERHVFFAVAAGLCILFTALCAIKGRQVEQLAQAAGVAARPLVGLSVNARALLTGPVVAVGVIMQLLLDPPLMGTLVLVLAVALMAHRTPLPRPVSRAPGRWLAISEEEAFAPAARPNDTWLDISTRSGKVGFVLSLCAVAVAAWATHRVSAYHAQLLLIDSTLLLALFATGRASELLPMHKAAANAELLRIARQLKKAVPTLRVVPWARFPQGQAEHDELRLLVVPRNPVRGLSGIEVGYSFQVGEGGPVSCPEILVRVADETSAANQARSMAPFGRWVKGRKGGEFVLSIEPRFGTWRGTAELSLSFVRELTEGEPKGEKASAKAPAKVRVKAPARPRATASLQTAEA